MRLSLLILTLFALTLSFIPAPAKADPIFIGRIDSYRDGLSGAFADPTYTVGLAGKEIEFWAFGIPQKELLDIEVGRVWPVAKFGDKKTNAAIGFGGYATWWPGTGDLFILPWLQLDGNAGRVVSSLSIGGYLPLGDGPTILFINEGLIGYRVSKKVTLGAACSLWAQESFDRTFRVGPTIKVKVGAREHLSLRYLFGEKGNDSIRFQWTHLN